MSVTEKTLPLWPAPPSSETPHDEWFARSSSVPRLWLCLLLPELALEVIGGHSADEPRAVVEEQDARRRLVIVNAAAARAGLMAGIELNTACAQVPALAALPRHPRSEQQALERLARHCARYTPTVSIEPPAALLLEIGASLHLFGGIEPIAAQLHHLIAARGHRVRIECAPTPLAALWLARAGALDARRSATLERPAEQGALAAQLGELPVDCLQWPASAMQLLHQLGLRQIRDCLRLPRDGFARRFGAARLSELDRALGRCPDLRSAYAPPRVFSARLDLLDEITDGSRLLEAARQLLAPLAQRLHRTQRGVSQLRLICHHRAMPDTRLSVGLLEPSGDRRHLEQLLAERLHGLVLPAPVEALSLHSEPTEAHVAPGDELFCAVDAAVELREPLSQIVERLRARLGVTAVHGLREMAEHRPERAWRTCEPGSGRRTMTRSTSPAARPLWVFNEPFVLSERAGRPCYAGTLRLERGPERIETGWWDDAQIGRDYYQARNPRGICLWIYREHHRPRRWYAHGAFG